MHLTKCSDMCGTDKKWIFNFNMKSENSITKMMLDKLRQNRYKKEKDASEIFVKEDNERDNFLTRSKILMEEAVKKKITEGTENDEHKNFFEIENNTPQFGDVRVSQEEAIRKAVNDNVKFESKALRYYPDADDMTLDGKIPALNLSFQFRYSDPSGADGLYIWCDAMQLSETNARTVGKIRDAYMNWRDSITSDSDLMVKLKKAAKENN